MTLVATCADNPGPAAGSSYASCSSVVWVDSSTLATGLFDGISMSDMTTLAFSVAVVWAAAFGIRACMDLIRES